VPVEVPADAPAWLRDSVADISKVDLGCHFAAVLAALIRLEKAAGYEAAQNKKLPGGKTRPQVIFDWIKGGRGQKTKKAPAIGDVDSHVVQWDAWWDSMQPNWRVRNAHGRWRTDAGYEDDWDWGVLDCTGVNGLLSAVGALYFWGVAVRLGPEDKRTRWEQSVLDVVWVLEGLEQTYD
jgi:hypothetical protein